MFFQKKKVFMSLRIVFFVTLTERNLKTKIYELSTI